MAAQQPPPPPPPPATPFVLEQARVAPRLALFGGRRLIVTLRFRASAPRDLKVHIRTPGGRVMRRWLIRGARPGTVRLAWDGLTTRGRVAPDARYRVAVGAVGEQRIGAIGATGNARTVGCHLHFETRGPRGPFDPLPQLWLWDRWS